MNNAAFTWKCGAHNLVLPRRISCPECVKTKRARLQASNKCLIDDFDYTQPKKKPLGVPKPTIKDACRSFTTLEYSLADMQKVLIPRVPAPEDNFVTYAKKDAELTFQLNKTRQSNEADKSRQRRRELLRPSVKEVEPLPDYFEHSPPAVRREQQHSMQALLNYIEHSSPAIYTRRCKIEDKLGTTKAARHGEENPTHVIFELFNDLVFFAVKLYRKDFHNTESVSFGSTVCHAVTMQLTHNYKSGLRVEDA